jgi:DNA-binding response OmpR family regulator
MKREYPRDDTPLWLVPERDVPTVLIADADEEVLLMLGFALAGEFDLMWARDGEQALRLALIEHPDVVVLDVHIPKLDGYRVAGQIRRNPSTRDTPVILLDSRPERIDVLRGFAAGANDYVTKPFDPGKLLARIHEALESTEIVCLSFSSPSAGRDRRRRRFGEDIQVRTAKRVVRTSIGITHMREATLLPSADNFSGHARTPDSPSPTRARACDSRFGAGEAGCAAEYSLWSQGFLAQLQRAGQPQLLPYPSLQLEAGSASGELRVPARDVEQLP